MSNVCGAGGVVGGCGLVGHYASLDDPALHARRGAALQGESTLILDDMG